MYVFVFNNGESYGIKAESIKDAMSKFEERWYTFYFDQYDFQVYQLNGYEI